MVSRFTQWTLDVSDVARMTAFWSAALGYDIDDDGQHLRPPANAPAGALTVWLQPSADRKTTKNRDHPDLCIPGGGDVEAEVRRLLALGATAVDVGQTGAEGFTVLADPEGNEFCLIHQPWRRDG
jgi:predicted enzyme related to lactoylglutathione lyase